MSLNSRELSVIVWLTLFGVWALSKPEIRRSTVDLLKVALQWKIAIPMVITVGYVTAIVSLLDAVRVWKSTDFKDTAIWFIGAGIPTALSGVRMQSHVPTIKQILKEQVGALLVIEYLISTYTFSFWIELALVPLITFFVLIQTFSQTKPEYARVGKATGCVIALIGFAALGAALWKTAEALPQVSLTSIARELALPIVLTTALLPLAYVFFMLSAYEQIFLRVDLGMLAGGCSGFFSSARRE